MDEVPGDIPMESVGDSSGAASGSDGYAGPGVDEFINGVGLEMLVEEEPMVHAEDPPTGGSSEDGPGEVLPEVGDIQPEMGGEVQPEEIDKKEFQKENHRRNSRNWHAKWIKKGVPREANPKPDTDTDSKKDMRVVCAEFIAKWIAESGMDPSNERRTMAYKAWMESDQRAALLAARAGSQM